MPTIEGNGAEHADEFGGVVLDLGRKHPLYATYAPWKLAHSR
jgi:hypothetical protein